jgi:hypothetical protein
MTCTTPLPASMSAWTNLAFGQRWTRPRAAMPITLLITTRHPAQLWVDEEA